MGDPPGEADSGALRLDFNFRQPRDVRVSRSQAYRLRDPAASQQRLAVPDRLSAEAPGRPPAARGAPLLRQLHLSGAKLEQAAPRRGQGRVASRRAVPARRLYRHQLGAAGSSVSSPSTTSAARASSTSRKARMRSNGRGCRAAPLPPTPSASSSTSWPTTSATSCARWQCPRARSHGR